MFDESLNSSQKEERIKEIDFKYLNTCFVNIVEEPEQNLYPSSQWQLLQRLLEFNNYKEASKLIMTSHSPYIVNYLSISIQGGYLKNKIKAGPMMEKLNSIVPLSSAVNATDVVIYQLDEEDGTIKKLPDYEGIPSDKNYLNTSLAEGNRLFDSLLELEEEL